MDGRHIENHFWIFSLATLINAKFGTRKHNHMLTLHDLSSKFWKFKMADGRHGFLSIS